MKRIAAILRAIVLGAIVLVFCANLWLLAARFLLGESLPKLFGFTQVTVLSGSMEPAFAAGDMVVIHAQSAYEVGDIVLFSANGVYVTHRIIEETDQGFRVQGDANNTPDAALVDPADVHGKVVWVIPKLGLFLQFCQTPFGMLLLLGLGLASYEGLNLLQERKERKNGETNQG